MKTYLFTSVFRLMAVKIAHIVDNKLAILVLRAHDSYPFLHDYVKFIIF